MVSPHVISAVMFDLDGVLIDSEPVWERIRREFAERWGGTWSDEIQRRMMGARTADWSEALSELAGGSVSPESAAEAIIGRLSEAYRRDPPLIPGAPEAVRALAREFRLGLVSGSPKVLIVLVLEVLGLQDCFEVAMSADDVRHGKPMPDPYLELARRLGVAPAKAAVIEDSGNGIRAGHAAGAQVVAIPRGAHQPDAETLRLATVVLKDIDELTPEAVHRLG
jgi:HAD superfamily hydrolase (TIGR01509 family)